MVAIPPPKALTLMPEIDPGVVDAGIAAVAVLSIKPDP
jgi:hypothetical protein